MAIDILIAEDEPSILESLDFILRRAGWSVESVTDGEAALERVRDAGYVVVNVDATVFLEALKLSPYKRAIADRIRELLQPFGDLAENAVNVKAKTMEGCDAVGELRAIAAQVAVLLESRG